MKNKKKKLYKKIYKPDNSNIIFNEVSSGFNIFFGIFFISFSIIALEILITRVSSLVYTYNYAFMAVSLAILGLGCGGIFSFYKWRDEKLSTVLNMYKALSLYSLIYASSIFLFLIFILKLPFFTNLFLYFIITFIPFFFAGIIISIAFKLYSKNIYKLYFFDLLGAALGALAGIFVLDIAGAINSILIIVLVVFIASLLFLINKYSKIKKSRNLYISSLGAVVIIIILLLNIFLGFLGELPIKESELKDLYVMLNKPDSNAEIIESRWSAFGRTDLLSLKDDDHVKFMFIDGAAGTPMFKFDGNTETAYQNLTFLNMIFSGDFHYSFLKDSQKNNMLIIGPGGGREVIIGLVNDIKNITGVEINKDFVEIVKKYNDYNGGIYSNFDNVKILVQEGRNYLEGSRDKYDIISIIQPFTKSSRSIEGYALTENYLMTAEAINNYINSLTDEGVLIVVLHNTNEIMRFISTFMSSFEAMGISNEETMDYFYTVGKEINPVIVISKSPFTEKQSEEIYKKMLATGLVSAVTYLPKLGQKNVNIRMEDGSVTQMGIFNDDLIAMAEGELNLQGLIQKTPYNIKPVTDNKPFFFKDEKGLPKNLFLILIITIIINLIIILASFLKAKKERSVSRYLILMMLLGFAFMIIEISFFQKLILYLGSPIYSLGIILGILLTGMSVGSLAGGKIYVNNERKKIIIFCILTSVLTLSFFFIISSLSNLILNYSFALKLFIFSLFLIPIGFLIGIPFPSAIRLARSYNFTRYIPWMYGLNATMSVLGSVSAIAISTIYGFSTSLVIGSICYILAAILFIFKWK